MQAGFGESAVPKNGFWSSLIYDEAGVPTMGVVRSEFSTLINAKRAPIGAGASGSSKKHQGTRMMCRANTDYTELPGMRDVLIEPDSMELDALKRLHGIDCICSTALTGQH